MADFLMQLLTAAAAASALFLSAAGLTLIFGVSKVVNFAHGTLYMLGAYVALTFMRWGVPFWVAVPLAACAIGVLGGVLERSILKRIYAAPELVQLLVTFALVLIFDDMVLLLWGGADHIGPLAPGFTQSVPVLGHLFPSYDIFLLAIGPCILLALLMLMRHTRFGAQVRAVTANRAMMAALGVNPAVVSMAIFVLGAALAGLGGALQIPREAVHPDMGLAMVVESFVVVVIGGMGSLSGAYLAALLVGIVKAFGVWLLPEASLFYIFVVMGGVLIVRPQGLLGRMRPPVPSDMAYPVERIAAPVLWAGLGIVAGLVALPWLLSGYFIGIASEVLIFAIFAVAVHMCLAVAGIVTFGHAAYLALGGYGAAIASTQYGVPFAGALAWGVGLAMAGGALISLVMARVHGVYLAMLTLAMAQIVYALSKQFVGLTGGDDGVLGVWPPAFLDQTARYYWCVLALAVGVCVGVQWAVRHPVGQRMRAARDDAVRYAALGGCAACQRALWFIASCALAGLAGGLLAFQKGSLFPDIASVANSVDGLVMVMLGGVSSLLGPWIGAIGYKVFETQIMSATDMWRLLLGGGILLLALWQPQGIAAVWRHQQKRWRFSPIKRVHKGRDHDD